MRARCTCRAPRVTRPRTNWCTRLLAGRPGPASAAEAGARRASGARGPLRSRRLGRGRRLQRRREDPFRQLRKATAVYQVRSANAQEGPWTYTVSPRARVVESFAVRAKGRAKYDLSVYGPNGYFRSYKGSVESWDKANLGVDANCEFDHGLTLEIRNKSRETARLRIFDAYSKRTLVAPSRRTRS